MVFSKSDRDLIQVCFVEKGWRGARIVKEFPGKNWKRVAVNRIIKKLEATGSTERKPGSGRPVTACTAENLEYVEENICSQEDNPGTHRSQRQIASDLDVSRSSVRKMTKTLNLKSYKRVRVSRRDKTVQQKRKTRCKRLDDKFLKTDVERIVFTDEKDFTVEVARNRQNDRVYGKEKKDISVDRLYHETSRFSRKIMVSAGVSWRGKTRIHFIDTRKTKVNSDNYIKLLDEGLLPDCRRLYPNDDYIFQQDGATSHTSRKTQQHLEGRVPNFIKKDEWPPQSPDCNPMDYSIWNSLSEKVYRGQMDVFTEGELKAKIRESWEEITLEEIQNSIQAWKKRLRVITREGGGPIDHLFK